MIALSKEVDPIFRWRIDVPRGDRSPVIRSRDAVKNLIDAALVRHGYAVDRSRPARYGFGVVAQRVPMPGSQRWHRVQRLIVGSSDPAIAQALAEWASDDLWEPNAVPGAGLDLRHSTLSVDPSPVVGEAISLYAVSPIRVVEGNPGQTILELGPAWEQGLNRTMARRFGRPFHLHVIPDSWYVRARHGQIVARMAVKVRSDGYVVAYPGLLLPFVLTGPREELDVAWYSGLGSSTAMGFGCVEVGQ